MTSKIETVNKDVKRVNEILKAGEPNNISVDSYSNYSGYRPQYVVDAMNQVFGVHSWGFEEIGTHTVKNAITTKKGQNDLAVSKVEVWIVDKEIKRPAWGQNQVTRGDYGDAKKSAQTDALKKALSYFSVGNRAYHGKLNVKQEPKGEIL